MHWITDPFRRYVDFRGRASRRQYWTFALICFAALMLLVPVDEAIAPLMNVPVGVPSLVFMVPLVCPVLAIAVRRLHDSNLSGWWTALLVAPTLLSIALDLIGIHALLWTLIDVVGPWLAFAVLAALLCREGTRGANRFGPDPKAVHFGEVFE